MGNQQATSSGINNPRFSSFNDLRTRNQSISNISGIKPVLDSSNSRSLLRRYKSVDGFNDVFGDPGVSNAKKGNTGTRIEKNNNAEISEAIDFAREVAMGVSLTKINTPINTPSLGLDSGFNNSVVSLNKFSKLKSREPTAYNRCINLELDYIIERMESNKPSSRPRPQRPPSNKRIINIDYLQEDTPKPNNGRLMMLEKKNIINPLDYSTQRFKTISVSSPESNNPNAFKIIPNQVFSFHQNLHNNPFASSNKKKQTQPERVIEENPYDNSLEISQSEVMEQHSEPTLLNSSIQQDRIASISKYLMGIDDPKPRITSQVSQPKYQFTRPIPAKDEKKITMTEEDYMEETLKRDSFPKRDSVKKFETPRKFDINNFRLNLENKESRGKLDFNQARVSMPDKPKFDAQPRELKVDLTRLNKNSLKPSMSQASGQNTLQKKTLRDHMMNARFDPRTDLNPQMMTRGSSTFKQEEEPTEIAKEKFNLHSGISYSMMHAKKKSSSIATPNNNMMDHHRNITSQDKIHMGADLNRQIQPNSKAYNPLANAFNNKMSLKTFSNPEVELSNNIIQKFRQSAHKKNSANQFFSTQVSQIRRKPIEPDRNEEESGDHRILNKILNNMEKNNSGFKPQRFSIGQNEQAQEDSMYNKMGRTTNSSLNSSKQNIKVDITNLSNKMKINIDSHFLQGSHKRFGK